MTMKQCVICELEMRDNDWGHNPWPVADGGKCCDACQKEHVLPARITQFYLNQLKEKQV